MSTFEVTSGKLIVIDPIFNMNIWCSCVIDNVKNGIYHSVIETYNTDVWGMKNKFLIVYHESVTNKFKRLKFRYYDTNIGVDSGSAGIFDHDKFELLKINEKSINEELLNGMGKVCESGYGDGLYTCTVSSDKGQIVAVKLTFINEG
jgi:hypothetical protein